MPDVAGQEMQFLVDDYVLVRQAFGKDRLFTRKRHNISQTPTNPLGVGGNAASPPQQIETAAALSTEALRTKRASRVLLEGMQTHMRLSRNAIALLAVTMLEASLVHDHDITCALMPMY